MPFHFQPHWFEVMVLMNILETWWNESQVKVSPGFVFHAKLKALKERIKQWVHDNIGKIDEKISSLEGTILGIEYCEEDKLLTEEELSDKHSVILELKKALKSE